jgi:hypothetical protein
MPKLKDYLNESTDGWTFKRPKKDGLYFVKNINERNGSLGDIHTIEVIQGGKFIKSSYGGNQPMDKFLGIGSVVEGGPRLFNGPYIPPTKLPSKKEILEFLNNYKQENPDRL